MTVSLRLDAWQAAGVTERAVWLDHALEALPDWLDLVSTDGALPLFEDRRCGQAFVLVPRTRVVIGLTEDRLAEVEAAMMANPLQLFAEDVHLPARSLEVEAHFAAVRPYDFEGREWLHRDRVPALLTDLAQRGWRLPSEVEWEVQWRSARPLFPLAMVGGELCADDWHFNYREAPAQAVPWGHGAELVRLGLTGEGAVEAHMPGRRPLRSTGVVQVRPVIDVPRALLEVAG